MSKPEPSHRHVVFDFAALETELRREGAYAREGRSARTLVREADLRVVLVAMQGGNQIADHRAQQTSSIHVLSGRLTLRLPDRAVELAAGRMLVLERGLSHEVEAAVDSAFLLTLGWREGSR
jgi:quercetin dioxygenase-like cupin family protein